MVFELTVPRAELDDGRSMRVNLGITTYQSGDLDLPPKSLSIKRPGIKPLTAVISRKIEYLAH